MGKLKRWWYLPKLLTIAITRVNFFNCPVKIVKEFETEISIEINHDFTDHGYLHSAIWKALDKFNLKRAQEVRDKQFFFQNVQNNEIFEIFKMFKNMLKGKFDAKTNSNLQNSMVVSILSVLTGDSYPFYQIWFKQSQSSV